MNSSSSDSINQIINRLENIHKPIKVKEPELVDEQELTENNIPPPSQLDNLSFNQVKEKLTSSIKQLKTTSYQEPLLKLLTNETQEFSKFDKKLKTIKTEYTEVLTKLDNNDKIVNNAEDGLIKTYTETHSNLNKLTESINNRKRLISELNLIKPILVTKFNIDELIKNNKLLESTKALNELLLDLDNLTEEQRSLKLIEHVEHWESFTREELSKKLVTSYFEIVKLSAKDKLTSGNLSQITINNIKEGHELIKLIDSLGSLHLILQPLHDFILTSWLTPFISHPGYHHLVKEDINEGKGIQLTISPNNAASLTVKDKLTELVTIISSITTYLIPKPLNLTTWFSQVYKDKLVPLLLSKVIYINLPKSIKNLEEMQSLEASIKEFEEELAKLDYLTSEDCILITKLTPSNTLFLENKLDETLHIVRQLLMLSDLETTQLYEPDLDVESTFEESSNFLKQITDLTRLINYKNSNLGELLNELEIRKFPSFPICLVTNTTLTLLEIINQLFLEINVAPANCKQGLLNIIIDSIQLYITLTPVRLANNLDEREKLICLIHNESSYLAHKLIQIPYQLNFTNYDWFKTQKSKFEQICNSLWVLSKQGLSGYFERVKEQISRNLVEIGSWDNLEYSKNESRIKLNLTEINNLIKPLNTHFKEILPNSIYYGLLGWLINFIISELEPGIMCLTDISADESEIIKKLCQPTINLIESNFNKSIINLYLPKFKKFNALVKIMECNLDQIFYLFSDEELFEEFGFEEIENLIRALFSTSEKRESVIKSIKEYY